MDFRKYRTYFKPATFLRSLGRLVSRAGTQTAYAALLLYYAYVRDETPKWAKRIVMGALGYLLMPIDAVPDLTPILGYTDDVTVLGFGLITVAAHINGEVRRQARAKLHEWVPETDAAELAKVDERLDRS